MGPRRKGPLPDRGRGRHGDRRDRRQATGRYCVTAPGINPNTVAPAVTVYWASTIGPEGNTSAMAAGGGCPGGDFPVNTERHGALTDADYANDVGFTIVIP